MKNQTLWVLGTGGTIAGSLNQSSTTDMPAAAHAPYTAAKHSIASLLSSMNDQISNNWLIESEQIMQIDSKDMNWNHWKLLVHAVDRLQQLEQSGSILITHGTDTIEETAAMLDWWMQHDSRWTKSITLTCAMRPADHPQADGPANLSQACRWAVRAQQLQPQVWVSAAQQVWRADQVQKNHPLDIQAIGSRNGTPTATWQTQSQDWQANSSASAGTVKIPLSIHAMHARGISSLSNWPEAQPWVEVIRSGACADPRTTNSMIESGVQGLIVECTGNGTWNKALDISLHLAINKKIPVAWVSRCPHGTPMNSAHPEEWADWSYFNASKARVWMMLELAFMR